MNTADSVSIDGLVQQAVSLHRGGDVAAASEGYRRALAEDPGHPEANHNLGIILVQGGQVGAGLAYLQTALKHDPTRDLYWLSVARAQLVAGDAAAARDTLVRGRVAGPVAEGLLEHARSAAAAAPQRDEVHSQASADALAAEGRFEEAASAYRAALGADVQPAAPLWLGLGNVLTELGQIDAAMEANREAIALDADMADAHYHLGSLLSENGRIAEGFAHLVRRAELMGPGEKATAPVHRVKHDALQRAYLIEKGVLAAGAPDPAFHMAVGARIDGPAVNPVNATPELAAHWEADWPKAVVIENFLTPAALQALRAFCAESTIWRRNYAAGYIGATPPDGFACPLLAQIAEEIATLYPQIIADNPFRYLGAFKYDSVYSTGTNTHADLSSVNVNFYIAPDEANLDPESGGMLIWDVEAASRAEMRRLNSDEAALVRHLKERSAKATHIPHRANRAVIFKSSLYHKTDVCRFADGYLNMRINVSLLFGDWPEGEGEAP